MASKPTFVTLEGLQKLVQILKLLIVIFQKKALLRMVLKFMVRWIYNETYCRAWKYWR